MKNKLLLVSCALFLFSGTAFAENLLVTKTSGGADEEGTLPYVVANAPGGSVIELSIGDETTVTIPETILIDKNLTIDGKGKTISVAEPGVSNYRIFNRALRTRRWSGINIAYVEKTVRSTVVTVRLWSIRKRLWLLGRLLFW